MRDHDSIFEFLWDIEIIAWLLNVVVGLFRFIWLVISSAARFVWNLITYIPLKIYHFMIGEPRQQSRRKTRDAR